MKKYFGEVVKQRAKSKRDATAVYFRLTTNPFQSITGKKMGVKILKASLHSQDSYLNKIRGLD